jgi:hypothetical protein
MSPLIATVLLIAFAVAMGAMIMNWSSSLGDGGGGPDCSGIRLIMTPTLCYAENAIKLNIRNHGDEIEGLSVKISDDNIENQVELKNSAMNQGDTLVKDIPFIKTSQTSVGLVPKVNHNGKSTDCEKAVIDVPDLKECS